MPLVSSDKAQIGIYTTAKDRVPQPNGQYIIDVSKLRDPMSNRGFRHQFKDGRASDVVKFVSEDDRIDAICKSIELSAYLAMKSPFGASGGSADFPYWLSFVLRDVHGTWIAPAVGEIVADYLSKRNYKVTLWHFTLRDIEDKEKSKNSRAGF